MKKALLALVALILSVSASAATASSLRVYIDPGHGSWTANDRPQALVNKAQMDTTGFFESNTNLNKAFGLMEKLIDFGFKFNRSLGGRNFTNNIVLARVKNGVNPDLSVRAAEAKANDFDMFISIHSNASSSDQTNYLYFAYDDRTGRQPTSKCIAMSQKAWDHRIADRHTQWTHYDNKVGAGSVKIGQQNLGVLNHNVPGYLSEGYFHTYTPARHRAMNQGVCYLEGYDYARGLADYFGITKDSTGDIYGVVRSATETFSHTYYNPHPGSNDSFKPLNGVIVYLYKGEQLVSKCTTDNFYNGAFVFRDLPTGTYTVKFESNSYASVDTEITVKAATVSYKAVKLPSGSSIVEPTEEYTFNSVYKNKAISELSGKTIQRVVEHNGKVYVLALNSSNEPTIVVLDIATGNVLANVSTTGMSVGAATKGDATRFKKCSDIQVSEDGYLLASNLTETVDANSNFHVIIYKWNNDANGVPTGNPTEFIKSQTAGWWNNSYTGETFAYAGTTKNGAAYLSAETAGSSGRVRVSKVAVANGTYDGTIFNSYVEPVYGGAYITRELIGSDYRFTVSPHVEEGIVITGSGSVSTLGEFKFVDSQGSTLQAAITDVIRYVADTNINGVSFFAHNSKVYAAMPKTSGTGSNTGVTMLDVADGISAALPVGTKNTTLTANTSPTGAVGHSVTIDGKDCIGLAIVRSTGVSYFLSEVDDTDTPDPSGENFEIDGSLTQRWIYSVNTNNLSNLTCFSSVAPTSRDMCYADGKIYLLNASTTEASVSILDAYTGKPTGATLSVDGIAGGTYILSGIKTLGSTIVGANMCGAAGVLKVYKWSSDSATPEVILETSDHGSMEVGRSMNTYGDMNEGIIAFGSTTGVVYYTVSDGVVDPNPIVLEGTLGGNASNQSVSFLADGTYWLNNKDNQPIHFDSDGTQLIKLSADIAGKQYGAAIKAFTYGQHEYVAFTSTLGSDVSSAWGNGVLKLVDVTDEAIPVDKGTYPSAGFGPESWGSVSVNSVDYEITDDGNTLNLWAMVPLQGIAMYQFKHQSSGVDVVEISDETQPIEWYNLQGLRVDGDNLTPGIYIKRQGNKVQKVLIR